VDIKLKKSDFKFDIITAFFLFGFLIVVVVTYSAVYIFNKSVSMEFKDKVKLSANNIFYIYKERALSIKKSTLALAKNDIFDSKFNVNPIVIKSVFKSLLLSNSDLTKIIYFNKDKRVVLGCFKREDDVVCNSLYEKLPFKKGFREKVSSGGIKILSVAPIKNRGFIEVGGFIKEFPLGDLYDVMFLGKNGNIFFNRVREAKSIYDVFPYILAKKILKKESGFISDDIYIKKLSKDLKLVFIQNRQILEKTNTLSQRLVLIMLIVSFVVAIPLGMFFSKPLYHFYEELDKRVKEEIEKRRQKEQLLMHQSKLAALGEMLGNIAHQWRHPLTRLSLLIQNLDMAFKMGKLDKKRFEKFKENALMQINYMSDTIDDFINFFKRDTKKVKFYPDEIINDALRLIEGRLKQNRVKVYLEVKNKEAINGYKTEFSQVILNILNNAIDVLKDKEERKIWIRVDGKRIEIEDSGGGVDKKIMDKIFEPYFTTKFQSQGTGIGLYMSKIIITKHFNGKLYVYNSKRGAVFVIEL